MLKHLRRAFHRVYTDTKYIFFKSADLMSNQNVYSKSSNCFITPTKHFKTTTDKITVQTISLEGEVLTMCSPLIDIHAG